MKTNKEMKKILRRLLKKAGVTFANAAIKKAVVAALCLVVSNYGVASTGTAIGTLSGAALESATLAWFGFGSMFAGEIIILLVSASIAWVVVQTCLKVIDKIKQAYAS